MDVHLEEKDNQMVPAKSTTKPCSAAQIYGCNSLGPPRILYRFPPLLPEPCAQAAGDMLTCYKSGCKSKQGCYMSEFHTPQKQLLL